MAGIGFDIAASEVASTTTAKTILSVKAATNVRVLMKEWGISFQGVSNTADPVLVEIGIQDGAGTSSAVTPVKHDQNAGETLQSTSFKNYTAEPVTTTVLQSYYVHPQTGRDWVAPFGGEFIVKGGQYLALRVTAAAGVDVSAYMRCEE
jgi:hypothetical protein